MNMRKVIPDITSKIKKNSSKYVFSFPWTILCKKTFSKHLCDIYLEDFRRFFFKYENNIL